jgi:alcohol dehydrogenase class IV
MKGATMRFEFATATRIIFGAGTLREIGPLAAELGKRALVVTGGNPDRANPLIELLEESGVTSTIFSVPGEPTTELACAGSAEVSRQGCDLVIGFGGGSALDAAKAIAGLAANGCDPFEFLEVVGQGKPLTRPALPYIAIPTTAGTGAEVTRNAVLAVPEQHVKVSLRSPFLLARLALVDPEMTYTLPPGPTANTGLDALTQLIEPYVSNRANPLTDALCREGIQRAARSLPRAYLQGDDAVAREDMAVASLFGGLALANARLGAAHGFAAPIGGTFHAPHGAICARLLANVMEVNIRALRARLPGSEALRRYVEVAVFLTGDEAATVEQGPAWVAELTERLQVPGLSAYGLGERDVDSLVQKAAKASSMQGNPVLLMDEELKEILIRSM